MGMTEYRSCMRNCANTWKPPFSPQQWHSFTRIESNDRCFLPICFYCHSCFCVFFPHNSNLTRRLQPFVTIRVLHEKFAFSRGWLFSIFGGISVCETLNWNLFILWANPALHETEYFIRRSAVQDIPRILWNQKFYYCVHNRSPLGSILNQINALHILTHHFVMP